MTLVALGHQTERTSGAQLEVRDLRMVIQPANKQPP